MLDADEVKEKQDYLRINILDKGYNADDFMQYLQMLRGEKGLLIENWSKNDLIKAVHDFQKLNPLNENQINQSQDLSQSQYLHQSNLFLYQDQFQNQINNNEDNAQYQIGSAAIKSNNENQQDQQNQQNEENPENPENENVHNLENGNNNKNVNKTQAEEFLQCKKSERNEISSQFNLIITLSQPKVTEGSLFTKSFITYLVETKPLGLQVRRRFSDFIWLHDILKSLYINCIIPQIVKKNYLTGITDIAIQKRMRAIEKFLQEIVNHPLLRNSQILYDFISIRDEKDFSLKKQAYNKISYPTKADQIKTLNGEVNISINKEKESLAEKIKKTAENNEDIMKKISKEYKNLNQQIQAVITKIKDINILWDDLYKKSANSYEGEIILGVYDSLAKFMEDWAKMQESQINLINVKLREYFRYIKNEYRSVKDYCKLYEDKKNDYKKSNQKLKDTKEKLFAEKKVSNWGMDREDLDNKILLFKEKELSMEKMLPEETKKVKDKKKLYGCFLNCLIEEYEKIQSLNSKRHKENIVVFIKEMSNTMITFHVSLNQTVAYLDTLKEDIFK